jgi:hypothetical protein
MLRLLAIMLAAALAACGAQPSQPAQHIEPAQIEAVSVEILESYPVQVVARIQGQLGNGCMSLGEITQRREGNTIEVSVPAIHSGAEVCTMQLQLINERLPLEGPFEPGDYTLIVNGVETSFSV